MTCLNKISEIPKGCGVYNLVGEVQMAQDRLLTEFMEKVLGCKVNEDNIKEFTLGTYINDPNTTLISYKSSHIATMTFEIIEGTVKFEIKPV